MKLPPGPDQDPHKKAGPHPDPHQMEKLDPDPYPHQLKIRIQIRIK
jgi:hypothetical protein